MTGARRLCMVVHGPYPVGEPRVARQARAARNAGYQVDVVAMLRAGEPAEETVDGIYVVRLPIEHRRGAGVGVMLREYLGFTLLATACVANRHLRHRYKVVQIHNPPDFLVVAGLLPKLLGARILLDVHDLSPDIFAARFEGRHGANLIDRVLRWIEHAGTTIADTVVTVHEPYRDELVARGVAPRKIAVVMNTLDEALLPTHQDRRSEDGAFRVVYHGTVNPWYGVDRIVEAFPIVLASVPNAVLEIYGEGDALPAIRERVTELGIGHRVLISGRAHPQRQVLELVRGADVGLIPNLPGRLNRYALSSKLFEYVALGIPVAMSDLPTLRAHFDDDEALFFRAGDAVALADAVVAISRDRAAAECRAERARERYETYRWHVNVERYLTALDGGTPHGRPVPQATGSR